MNSQIRIVGIDVSKKKLDVALLTDGKVKSKVVDNTPEGVSVLTQWLVDKQKVVLGEVHACMESTGIYSEPVARALHKLGILVSVVNPNCIKSFGQSENARNKTDKADAAVIARYCQALRPEPWVPPPEEQRLLRAWMDRLSALKDIRQQELNRIEAHVFAGENEVSVHVQEHVKWLDTQIKQLENDIDTHIDNHPDLKRHVDLLVTVPGVGRLTAGKFIAFVGDVKRFPGPKSLAAFIGVTPKQRTSGTSVRGRTMMCRMGNRAMRAALYLPSISAGKWNPLLNAFKERLLAMGKSKMAVVGALMRKLVHMMYGVLKSGKPFDAGFSQKRLAVQDGI
jgi:transposase